MYYLKEDGVRGDGDVERKEAERVRHAITVYIYLYIYPLPYTIGWRGVKGIGWGKGAHHMDPM